MTEIKTKRYLPCPNCGQHDFLVDHVIDDYVRELGPWSCRVCHHDVRFTAGNGRIENVTSKPSPYTRMLSLLRFRDLYVVVDFYSRGHDQGDDWYDYKFHSHQCPTNIMGSALEVYDPAEGRDPHGIFRFVAALPDTEENRKKLDGAGSLQQLFLLFDTDGQEAPTRWPENERGLLPGLAKAQDEYTKMKAAKA